MKHLTAADRGKIETLLQEQCTNKQIAERVGRSPSTIGREIAKGLDGNGVYHAWIAQVAYEANRGRVHVEIDSMNDVTVTQKAVPAHLKTKQIYNPDYPYKQVIACPQCNKTLSGSATRGRKGTYYPAYHY